MNCLEYRHRLLANPAAQTPDLVQHRQVCPQCAVFSREWGAHERALRSALEIAPAPNLANRILLSQHLRQNSWPWRRVATMAFAALVLGIGLWHWQRPTVMAGSDIVLAHVLNEPETWSHDEPITYPQLRAVLAEFNLALNDVDVAVRYLHRCAMPGGQGLHIVLAKPQLGDLTLLIPPSGTVYAEGVTMREGFEASMLAVGTRKVGLVTPQHSSHQAVADWVRQQLTTSSGPTRS